MMLLPEDVVAALYRVLLSREPEEVGLRHWAASIANDEIGVEGLIKTIITSSEFAEGLADFVSRNIPSKELSFTNDVSQFGEVAILIGAMVNRAASHRVVIDVGANGRARSNSYDLLRHFGWRGVLVEANPGLLEQIRSEFDGLDYTLINCAVSDYSGHATFHVGSNADVSSLDMASTQAWGEIRGSFDVSVERLPDILRRLDIPSDFDVLSVDAEGEDTKILNDVVSAGFRPQWVIIELSADGQPPSMDQFDVSALVRENYSIVGSTIANIILRARS